MLMQLNPEDNREIARLFDSLASYNVVILSSFDKLTPSTLLVDHPENPTVAVLHTVEGSFIVGNSDAESVAVIKRYLDHAYFTEERQSIYLHVDDDWRKALHQRFKPDSIHEEHRQHYICTSLKYIDWKAQIPAGFEVMLIDEHFLNIAEFDIPPHINRWMMNNWGTLDNYLKHGFGACVRYKNQIVSWSLADCSSDDRCEIGIRTHEDFRQRGFASLAAAACVDYALTHGFAEVGWHCDADNVGSWKTAKKVGFVKERDYISIVCTRSDDS